MKRFVSLVFVLVVMLSVSADPISQQQAHKQAERFLQQKGLMVGSEAVRARGRQAISGIQPLYVFNTVGDHGFVIVAGDDRVDGVIGYTTRGHFDEATMPANFRAWLEQTSAEIDNLARQPRQSVTRAPGMAPTPLQVPIHGAIDPLIITEWNQGNTDNVYNAHLPQVEGQQPCTGCVATAGAQVMYYYRWPQAPTQVVPHYQLRDGNGSNYSNGADTSNDLPSITFQWDKMKTRYDYRELDAPMTEDEDAVADLMLYCGYAAQMNYGLFDKHGGSSASTYILADGMSKYFDYNPYTWKLVNRSDYSIREWDELVYNELACGRPVIYSGYFSGGHAFICDGYDGAGLFHFNWGWGGDYNGYFKLQVTNPRGNTDISDMGFIADNDCIIGLQPNSWPAIVDPNADDEWETPEIEGIVASALDVTVEGTTVYISLGNMNEMACAFGYGIGELNDDGTITIVNTDYDWAKDGDELPSWNYYPDVPFDFSTYDLSEGTHFLVPISILNGEAGWRRCKPADLYFEVNVTGGEKTITAHPVEDLTINEFDLATGGTPGNYQGVIISVTNHGDNLEKTFCLYLGTAEDKGEFLRGWNVKIANGNTKEYRVSTSKLEAGTYTLWLTADYEGNKVLAKKEITITQDLSATDFMVIGDKSVDSELQVDVTVENHAGDYAVPLYLFASTSETMDDYAYAAGSAIEQGSSEVVTFYFKATEEGTWNLWVATDPDGNNVIGQSTVEIKGTVEPGDLNGDKVVDAEDVKAMLEYLMGTCDIDMEAADLNEDGVVNIADIILMVSIILKE